MYYAAKTLEVIDLASSLYIYIKNPFLIQVSAQQEPLFTDLSSDGIKTDASERFIYGPLSDD